MLGAPLPRQLPRDGGLEDGLAVALHQLAHALQRALAFVDLAEEFFDAGDDALLLGLGRQRYRMRVEPIACDVDHAGPVRLVVQRIQCVLE
jgi:hypothetical protein